MFIAGLCTLDLQNTGGNDILLSGELQVKITHTTIMQQRVCESCENVRVGGMIGTMMAPGYSSCNPAITQCVTLHGASA